MIPPKSTLLCALLALASPAFAQRGIGPDDPAFLAALERSDINKAGLEIAVGVTPEREQGAMRWLIAHMPQGDLLSLSTMYLAENHRLAFEAWNTAPWKDSVSEEVFLDAVLPYASVNEFRDEWRGSLRERCLPLVEGAKSPSEAAAMLNNSIWKEFNVKYSTKREKPDQSPLETMRSGLASCTGLSVLLIDACRAVGVPARFVGTPRWSDDSGNHSWVEIWDDGWHFTGAAEPTGDKLDQGWFSARAAGALADQEQYAIYAVSWRDTPISFPMVWRPKDKTVNAVNVTARYTRAQDPLPAGQVRVRFCAFDGGMSRVAASVRIEPILAEKTQDAAATQTLLRDLGQTKDERFDSNDHLVGNLKAGQAYRCEFQWNSNSSVLEFVAADELLITVGGDSQANWSSKGLTRVEAQQESDRLWTEYASKEEPEARARVDARVLELGELRMPFDFEIFGEVPQSGHSLFISMHGGGGAPKKVNDQQWENQKRLYQLTEGIYLAPRAPTDTWNLWHQSHIDVFFDRLIQDMVLAEGVNPDRVYLTGYSAGGDGVYQLAPRMADRFAAAGMMAGHPNETLPDGLRNLPFALHVGGEDAAYDRNRIAADWKLKLAELAAADPGGYVNQCEVHAGKGHWMDREEAPALEWMAEHSRSLRSKRIVWIQDDVLHSRFYWLRNSKPKPRERIVVERRGQLIEVLEAPGSCQLELLLDDFICNLDEEIVVLQGRTELYRGKVRRTSAALTQTLAERGDPRAMFCAVLKVETLPE